ncbi:MAG TPA: lipoyl(octanoyl) transferase LipB [Pelagibacteraceae bacterium]|jgi:lipoyl(octanoyl) transferase|nr:lipoyl(octanoyl) transferase LipB [Pelagibacteraceae bacterium]
MAIEVKKSRKLIDYNLALKFLEKRVEDVINGKKPELLWILEHKPIFTAGTRSKENEILNKTISVSKTSRGGKITYHGPGQKVVYFVLNLNKRGKDIRKLIKHIENCIIKILKEYGIKSFNDKKNIGIWVNVNGNAKKVAAIGIRVKRWIAFHGFSINISNDLEVYKNIVPCGIYGKGITNLCSVKKNNYKYINQRIIDNFLRVFK